MSETAMAPRFDPGRSRPYELIQWTKAVEQGLLLPDAGAKCAGRELGMFASASVLCEAVVRRLEKEEGSPTAP